MFDWKDKDRNINKQIVNKQIVLYYCFCLKITLFGLFNNKILLFTKIYSIKKILFVDWHKKIVQMPKISLQDS
jgi:hypothetical protein